MNVADRGIKVKRISSVTFTSLTRRKIAKMRVRRKVWCNDVDNTLRDYLIRKILVVCCQIWRQKYSAKPTHINAFSRMSLNLVTAELQLFIKINPSNVCFCVIVFISVYNAIITHVHILCFRNPFILKLQTGHAFVFI